MNQLTKFVFPLTNQETRIVDHNGDPWFVARDVCIAIGLSNPSAAAARLDDDERGIISVNTPGGPQDMVIVNEAGLYSLIIRSDKPEAKVFRRWVTHEVLPQIRKTGAYGETLQDALSSPDALRMILLGYTEKVIALEAKVAEQAPKVEALKRLEGADGSMCITDAAKALKVRPKDLFAYLSAQKWTYKRAGTTSWIGYQDKIQAGLIEMNEFTQLGSDGVEKVRVRARITAKGLARLAAEFNAVPSN